jgi:hypothetical protein
MKTKFDVRDLRSLRATRTKDENEGIIYTYSLELEMFPDNPVPIDAEEYIRLTKAFARGYKSGTIIEA